VKIIIRDNIRYLPLHYESEDELEAFLKKYLEVISGSGAIIF